MGKGVSRIKHVLALGIVTLALLQSGYVFAPPLPLCVTTLTYAVSLGPVGSSRFVSKRGNFGNSCFVVSSNVFFCEGVPNYVVATAKATSVAPYCQVTCTACTGGVRIDGSDGLPVELMKFSVESQ